MLVNPIQIQRHQKCRHPWISPGKLISELRLLKLRLALMPHSKAWSLAFLMQCIINTSYLWKLGRLTPFFDLSWQFFVFQDRNLKHSIPVWNGISWNFTKFQLIKLIQTIFIFIFSLNCLIELKFHEISWFFFFKQMLKLSAFYLGKKSFIF